MVESAPPRQSVVRLFSDVVCARDCEGFFSDIFPGSKILAGTSPLDPLAELISILVWSFRQHLSWDSLVSAALSRGQRLVQRPSCVNVLMSLRHRGWRMT